MSRIPDNEDIRQAIEDRHERALEELPDCGYCEEPIQQDTAVQIEGIWYCDHCLKLFRRECRIER